VLAGTDWARASKAGIAAHNANATKMVTKLLTTRMAREYHKNIWKPEET
jgi:hypothetical protein